MVGLSCFSLSIIDKLRLATRRKMPLGVFIYIFVYLCVDIYRYVANHKGILFPQRATQALTSAFISSQRKGPQENSPTSLDTSCHDNVPQAIRWGFSTSPATPRSEWMRGRFTGLPGKRRLLDIDHWRFCGRNPKLIKGHLLYKMVLSIGCEPKSLLIGNGCLITQLSI